MAQNVYHPSKLKKGSTVRKYCAKIRKTRCANTKLLISMSDVRVLFRSPSPFSFVDCNTFLSPGLVPYSVSSSAWQISHDSDLSNTIKIQASLSQFHIMAFGGLNAMTPLIHTWLHWLPYPQREISQPFSCFLDCKARATWPKLSSYPAC